MDLNDDGVITRQEFDVAALELQLRNQAPVGGGRYDSTSGNESWLSQSPKDGSVGTDRTASAVEYKWDELSGKRLRAADPAPRTWNILEFFIVVLAAAPDSRRRRARALLRGCA